MEMTTDQTTEHDCSYCGATLPGETSCPARSDMPCENARQRAGIIAERGRSFAAAGGMKDADR